MAEVAQTLAANHAREVKDYLNRMIALGQFDGIEGDIAREVKDYLNRMIALGRFDGIEGDITLESIHRQMRQMGMGHLITQQSPERPEQVEVSTVQPEEWLEWIGLTQYSGRFSNAVVEAGLLYLKSYTGYWFQVCGVRITHEVLIDHEPWLQQISQ